MSTAYGMRALADELYKLAGAGEGARNNTLNTVWLKLYPLTQTGHLDHNDAYQRILEAATQIGLPEDETRRTMASAENGARKNPQRVIPEPKHFAQPGAVIALNGHKNITQTEPNHPNYDGLYLPRSGLANLPTADTWIDNVLDQHTLFAVTGRDRSYKSFLILDWLACLATGKKWLTHKTQQTKVLYIVGEGAYGLHHRLKAWEIAWQTPIPDNTFHIRTAPINLFKREADCIDLFERIRHEQYGVIIFDTLQRMASGAETNSAKDASIIISAMDILRRANNNLSVGIVAHTTKADDSGIRGSSALEDDLDLIWRVKRDDDTQTIHIELAKRKDGPEGTTAELIPEPVIGTNSIVLKSAKSRTTPPPEHHLPLLKTLAKAGESGESKTALVERLDISVRKLYIAADWLEEKGWITRSKSSRSTIWCATQVGRDTLERIDELSAE